jgi:fatty-acyl-CoA synthase
MLRHRHAIALIRCDEESGEPIRDAHGLCCRCRENEVGEAIAEVRSATQNPATQFEGYTDPQASQKKLLGDVFAPGDRWYRTGDLMRKDAAGYFYFVDRLGDTYRWKGENVATTEVAECLRGFAGVSDAIVYGVRLPGTEGRAGMATLEAAGEIDLTALRRHVVAQLPPYARPLFVRLSPHIPVTGTHKPRKGELQREGYDPNASADRIYFDDTARETYVVLDDALFQRLQAGAIRV